jgi:hypothetical protein
MLDSRFPAVPGLAIGVLLVASAAWTQQTGMSKASSSAQPAAPTTGLGGQPGAFPKDTPRAVFLSGKVLLEDGTLPPERAAIQRIGGGEERPGGREAGFQAPDAAG